MVLLWILFLFCLWGEQGGVEIMCFVWALVWDVWRYLGGKRGVWAEEKQLGDIRLCADSYWSNGSRCLQWEVQRELETKPWRPPADEETQQELAAGMCLSLFWSQFKCTSFKSISWELVHASPCADSALPPFDSFLYMSHWNFAWCICISLIDWLSH